MRVVQVIHIIACGNDTPDPDWEKSNKLMGRNFMTSVDANCVMEQIDFAAVKLQTQRTKKTCSILMNSFKHYLSLSAMKLE